MTSRPLHAALFSAALTLLATSTIAQGTRNSEVAKACEADVKALCPGVQPGQGRIAQCLRKNQDKVSDGCKAQLKEARARAKEQRREPAPK
jgi:hypothetical protein